MKWPITAGVAVFLVVGFVTSRDINRFAKAAGEPPPVQPVPLKITGDDVKTVIVVGKLPATVHAPAGLMHRWRLPATVEATEQAGGTLKVTRAPRGQLTVSVEWIVVDFEKKVAETKAGEIAFVVGGVEPEPPPVPDDPFVASVKAAYAADGKPAAAASQLASIWRTSKIAVNNQANTTAKQILDVLHTSTQGLIGDQLPKTRNAIADELDRSFAKTTTLTPEIRAKMLAEFARVAAALDSLK